MSLEDLDALDRQRRRWLFARARLHLVDPQADDFGIVGLAARVREPSVRLLLLPADPDAWLLDFDRDFWSWWPSERSASSGPREYWGYDDVPSEYGALRAAVVEEGRLAKYLALHHNGALEFELGEDGAFVYPNSSLRVFRLNTIVSRVHTALSIWDEVRDRFRLDGPSEMSLALRNTEGSALGDLAAGATEPNPHMKNRLCPTKHLLCRRDIWNWPDAAGQMQLTASIGGWLEDAWGRKERRFNVPGLTR